jgi:hypothetical protein
MNNTNSKKTKTSESAKPPVAKLRIGLLTASIWERATDNGTFYSVTFERRYRDAKGEWHGTQSFDKSNLLSLAKLADQADSEIARLSAGREKAAA